jgi:hypothetical protein
MFASEQVEQASAAMGHHDMSAVRKALKVKPSEGKKLISGVRWWVNVCVSHPLLFYRLDSI